MTDAIAPLRDLVEAVYKKTMSAELDWTFDQEADVCEANIGEGYLHICSDVDDYGDHFYYVKILNWQKQVIDTVYGGTLGQGLPSTGHANYWSLITDLRTAAHRKAVGADAVIRSMLTALGRNDPDLDDDVPF